MRSGWLTKRGLCFTRLGRLVLVLQTACPALCVHEGQGRGSGAPSPDSPRLHRQGWRRLEEAGRRRGRGRGILGGAWLWVGVALGRPHPTELCRGFLLLTPLDELTALTREGHRLRSRCARKDQLTGSAHGKGWTNQRAFQGFRKSPSALASLPQGSLPACQA